MKKKNIISFFCLLFITASSARSQPLPDTGGKQVDFKSLLKALPDRENLAHYPGGTWTLHHASSYDRRSVEKDQEGWYANKDWDNYIRKENNHGREEYVLMDADGPGVIVRFWGGGHPNQKAHLRFYIDGQAIPFWEADHWGALIGQNEAIGHPLSERSVEQDYLPINRGAQPGHNLYAPLPFAHHIKITWDKSPGGADSGFWYNIDYRIYSPAVPVESFSARTPVKDKAILQRTNRTLKAFMDMSPLKATVPGEKKVTAVSFDLQPGASKVIHLTGQASIKRLLLSLKADSMDSAVKNTWLQIAFDGKTTVDVPAGLFFGCGDQLVTARSWYNKVDSGGNMAGYWVMPYQHEVVIRLLNQGHEKISGSMKVATGTWKWDRYSMYFHAGFKRIDHFTVPEAREGTDINYLDLEGKAGVYVGDILQVRKTTGGWWGEGDEKIYVDGSAFPTDFGTGSEDYYGYAWGHPETFNHIFNSQPLGNANLGDRGGITVDSRERGLDAIPFHNSIRFDMESLWHGAPIDLARACFWYEKAE